MATETPSVRALLTRALDLLAAPRNTLRTQEARDAYDADLAALRSAARALPPETSDADVLHLYVVQEVVWSTGVWADRLGGRFSEAEAREIVPLLGLLGGGPLRIVDRRYLLIDETVITDALTSKEG